MCLFVYAELLKLKNCLLSHHILKKLHYFLYIAKIMDYIRYTEAGITKIIILEIFSHHIAMSLP